MKPWYIILISTILHKNTMEPILKTGMTLYILMNMSGIQDLLTDVNQSNEGQSFALKETL